MLYFLYASVYASYWVRESCIFVWLRHSRHSRHPYSQAFYSKAKTLNCIILIKIKHIESEIVNIITESTVNYVTAFNISKVSSNYLNNISYREKENYALYRLVYNYLS